MVERGADNSVSGSESLIALFVVRSSDSSKLVTARLSRDYCIELELTLFLVIIAASQTDVQAPTVDLRSP